MGKMKQVLVKLIRSPHFSMWLGIVLFLCGILEMSETFIERFLAMEVKSHHGLMVFGFGHLMKSIVDIVTGAEALVVAETAKALESVEGELKEFEQKSK